MSKINQVIIFLMLALSSNLYSSQYLASWLESFTDSVGSNNSLKIPSPTSSLIMAIDYTNSESFAKTLNYSSNSSGNHSSNNEFPLKGFGAISVDLLAALDAGNYPILASTFVLKNILEHKRFFLNFVKLSTDKLIEKYSNSTWFNETSKIRAFQELCKYYLNNYKIISKDIKNGLSLEEINSKKEFSVDFAPESLKDGNPNFTCIVLLLCARQNFRENWIIKKVDNELCLLIPKKSVSQKLNQSELAQEPIESVRESNIETQENLINPENNIENISGMNNLETKIETDNISFSALEKELGLQIDHLSNLSQRDIFNLEITRQAGKTPKFMEALSKIFIPKEFYIKSNSKVPVWAFYITGHGFPPSGSRRELQQLNSLILHYNKQIKKNLKKCENKHSKSHVPSCKYRHKYQNDTYILDEIKGELENIQSKQKTKLDDAIIISLPKWMFTQMLIFFNENISTGFLFYSSCYAGGENLISPYIKENKPLILNYPIISGTLAENSSIIQFPIAHLAPFNKYKLTEDYVDYEKNRLSFNIQLRFTDFFEALKSGQHKDENNLFKISSYLGGMHKPNEHSPAVSTAYRNAPCYRPANSNKFFILTNIPGYIIFDKQKIDSIQKDIFEVDAKACLLYDDNLPFTLKIENKTYNQDPIFVSMNPGLSAHTINGVISDKLNLIPIFNAFLALEDLSAPKIFWIKNMSCKLDKELEKFNLGLNKAGKVELEDVIILRNIFTQKDIKRSREAFNLKSYDTIYFTDAITKKSYQFKWQDPDELTSAAIENSADNSLDNSKSGSGAGIELWEVKGYQKEILAFKPDILSKFLHGIKDTVRNA